MHSLLSNPQNAQQPGPNTNGTEILINTNSLALLVTENCPLTPYQTTEDKMQPNYPIPESRSPHRLGVLTKRH